MFVFIVTVTELDESPQSNKFCRKTKISILFLIHKISSKQTIMNNVVQINNKLQHKLIHNFKTNKYYL